MDEENAPRKFIPIMRAGTPIQTPTTIWEKWVFYSPAINKAPPLQFLLPITHMLGYQDAFLRKWESEFVCRPKPASTDPEIIADTYKMFESYLWVLSTYEVVRTLSQSADQNKDLFSTSIAKKIRDTKHKLEEIRIPLAKLEPRRVKGETALALPSKFKNTFGWTVEPGGKFYSRRELADTVLELLKFMYESE
jgi:hypothetical protein